MLLTYVIARRLFDRRVAALGSMALALFPGQIYFSSLVMTETFFALVFLLAFLLTVLWTLERDGAWWQVLILGLVVGFAALIRSEAVFLVPIIGLLWLLAVRPWGRLLRYVPALLLGVALVLTPWTVRNAIQLDEFVPLREGSQQGLAAGLNPDFSEASLRGLLAFRIPAPPLGESLTHWLTHPWEIPSFVALKLRMLYEDDADGIAWAQTNPRYLSEREERLWSNLANGYFFAVGALALLAIPRCVLSGRQGQLALVVVGIGWSLVFVPFIPETRYHFPLVPLLSILAAASVVMLWEHAVRLRGTGEAVTAEA